MSDSQPTIRVLNRTDQPDVVSMTRPLAEVVWHDKRLIETNGQEVAFAAQPSTTRQPTVAPRSRPDPGESMVQFIHRLAGGRRRKLLPALGASVALIGLAILLLSLWREQHVLSASVSVLGEHLTQVQAEVEVTRQQGNTLEDLLINQDQALKTLRGELKSQAAMLTKLRQHSEHQAQTLASIASALQHPQPTWALHAPQNVGQDIGVPVTITLAGMTVTSPWMVVSAKNLRSQQEVYVVLRPAETIYRGKFIASQDTYDSDRSGLRVLPGDPILFRLLTTSDPVSLYVWEVGPSPVFREGAEPWSRNPDTRATPFSIPQ